MAKKLYTNELGAKLWYWTDINDIPAEVRFFMANRVKVVPEGFDPLSGNIVIVDFRLPEPWRIVGAEQSPAPNPLLLEFWGNPIPMRATPHRSRQKAIALEQARQKGMADTTEIRVLDLPETYTIPGKQDTFPVLKNYIDGGMGDRCLCATLTGGKKWCRFTAGRLGNPFENAQFVETLVLQGHPTVYGEYQERLLNEIERTGDLSLGQGVTWVPFLQTQWDDLFELSQRV